MPRVFSQSLQTAGKAADTAEVDIDKHFLQFWQQFFACPVPNSSLHQPSPSRPLSLSFSMQLHHFSILCLPHSPTPSFPSVFFSPSRLDSLLDKPYRPPTLPYSSLTLHSLSLPLVLCLAHADCEPSVLAGPSKRTYWTWCQHLQAYSMHPFITLSSASWLGRGLLSNPLVSDPLVSERRDVTPSSTVRMLSRYFW